MQPHPLDDRAHVVLHGLYILVDPEHCFLSFLPRDGGALPRAARARRVRGRPPQAVERSASEACLDTPEHAATLNRRRSSSRQGRRADADPDAVTVSDAGTVADAVADAVAVTDAGTDPVADPVAVTDAGTDPVAYPVAGTAADPDTTRTHPGGPRLGHPPRQWRTGCPRRTRTPPPLPSMEGLSDRS